MGNLKSGTKRIQVDKTNLLIVIVVLIATFVTVFSLTASKSLFGQLQYQSKVIEKKETAKKQILASVMARDKLVEQYASFVGTQSNVIGGSATGTGDRDGDSGKIILDALPSKYDYPALTTSLEKLTSNSGLTIDSISGTDDEVNQAVTGATPQPVDMPFTLSFSGNNKSTQDFLDVLQRSIRPVQIQQVTFSGTDDKLVTSLTAKTYYQPEKTFKVKSEVVKR